MKVSRRVALAVALLLLPVSSGPVEAAGARKAVARGAARSVARSARQSVARILRLDRIRDARAPVVRLAVPRTAFRYVTPQRARLELRRGIARNSHLTSRATRGRPLSVAGARTRFGLRPGRTQRLTVRLDKGAPVRFGKALRGAPGVGEITVAQPVRPGAVRKVVRLPGAGAR